MIATVKEVKYDLLICHVCGKSVKSGESYEKIITQRNSEIIIHTDCTGK